MKKAIKISTLALIMAAGLASCSGTGNTEKADSSTIVTTKTDTLLKTDTAHADTPKLVADTPAVKIDTLSKTVIKQKVVKKTVTKKP